MNVVHPASILAMGLFAFVGCTDAGGSVQGGEAKIDTTPPPIPLVEAGAPADGGFHPGKGITFTDLHHDYFGRLDGGPGCAGDGQCHGDATQLGAMGSGGYVCPPNDKNACYLSMTGGPGLVSPSDSKAPRAGYLINTLRHVENGALIGIMPKRPTTFVFTETDIVRINDWIAAGAQNN